MARPRKYNQERPSTPAERKRRERQRRKNPLPPPEDLANALFWKSQKVQAAYFRVSERTHYYHQQYLRYRTFDWGEVLGRRSRKTPNRVGVSFAAEVSKHSSPIFQRHIYDTIKTKGIAEARMLWRAYCNSIRMHYPLTAAVEDERQSTANRKALRQSKARASRRRNRKFIRSYDP